MSNFVNYKFIIIGLGSIAKRHIKNLKLIEPQAQIAVFRHSENSLQIEEDIRPLIQEVFFDSEKALAWGPQAAIITNPASFHIDWAQKLALIGCHLLIEKPISNTIEHIDELKSFCKKKSLVAAVGYNFKFYKPFQILRENLNLIGRVLNFRAEAGQYLPDWRPQNDYSKGVSAQKALGGGVLLELSHELDYARWLMGEVCSVTSINRKLSSLKMDVEDTAELLLEFSSGAIGNIHIDMTDRARTRHCRIIGTEGTLFWDGLDHSVKVYKDGRWTPLWESGKTDLNEMYIDELKHFIAAMQDKHAPITSLEDAEKILKIVLAAKQSSKERKSIII